MADLELELPSTGVSMDELAALTTPADPQGWEVDIAEILADQSLSAGDEFVVDLPVKTAFIVFDCEDVADGVYWSFQENGTDDPPAPGVGELASELYSPARKYARRGADIRLRTRKDTLYMRTRTPGSTGKIFFTLGQ